MSPHSQKDALCKVWLKLVECGSGAAYFEKR